MREHHKTKHNLLRESGLVQLLDHIAVLHLTKKNLLTYDARVIQNAGTAEFGTKLMNCLRELKRVNVTFHF